ncbi:mitochondrial cardiolipin hydrolase isoform X2 [Odocoileus virginianus]|uniref:Mitochondrial cardiolipin hydrolase isoform X2 n=1 Tax=Odocoileus virginianus TaxID=9874 RepID=A0ABM4J370_ODOVR
MRPLRWQVAVVAAAGLALALETLPAVFRWLWVRRRRPRREVLFFPSQVTCTEALLRSPGDAPSGCPCSLPHGESSLSRLLSALLAARASLELCLFAFSSPQLGRAVQLLHQRGVRVRVVTDCDYMALNGSQIGLLRKAAAKWQGSHVSGGPAPHWSGNREPWRPSAWLSRCHHPDLTVPTTLDKSSSQSCEHSHTGEEARTQGSRSGTTKTWATCTTSSPSWTGRC